jgi:PST family polysaccharide transporter
VDPERHLRVDHLEGDLHRSSVRGGAAVLSGQAARLALQLGSTAVLARLLAPADFGLVAMLTVVTGFVELFTGMGLATAAVQRRGLSHAQASALFWVSAAVGAALALATVLLAPAVAALYGEPRLAPAAAVLAATFALGGLGVQQRAVLRRQMRFGALAAVDGVGLAGGIAVAIAMAWRGDGYWALIGKLVATSALTSALLWLVCPWRPGPWRRGADSGGLLAFGGRVSAFHVLNYAASNVDQLLIGWRFGPAPLGLYSRASQLVHLPLRQLNAPLAGVFVSALSRLTDDPVRYRRAYLGVLEKIALFAAPTAVLAIGTADWIVALLLGSAWSDATPILAALGVSALLKPVGHTTGWLLISQDRTRTLLRWGVFDAATRGLAVLLGLPGGPLGVAVALAVRGLLLPPVLVWVAGRSGPVRAADVARACGLPALVGAAAAAAVVAARSALPAAGPSGLAATAACAAAASVLVLCASPAGRRALAELRVSFRLLVTGRPQPAAQ